MRYLTIRQVADALGYKDVDSVHAKIRAGRLRATRTPGSNRWRVEQEDLERFMGAPITPRPEDRHERAKRIADANIAERIRRGELPDPRAVLEASKRAKMLNHQHEKEKTMKLSEAKALAAGALEELDAELPLHGYDPVTTSLQIGRCIMHMRGAIDNHGTVEYDFEADPEGYQVSILLALMHWSNSTEGRRSFWADLQRAKEMFTDDMTPEVAEPQAGRTRRALDTEAENLADYVQQGDCELTCERCDLSETFDTNRREDAAEQAAEKGWRYIDDEVLCPACVEKVGGVTL